MHSKRTERMSPSLTPSTRVGSSSVTRDDEQGGHGQDLCEKRKASPSLRLVGRSSFANSRSAPRDLARTNDKRARSSSRDRSSSRGKRRRLHSSGMSKVRYASNEHPRSAAQPHALFMMGLPGSGKSTLKRRRMRRDDVDIEADRLKKKHPNFSYDMGDETDEEVHRWSVRRSVDDFEDAISSSTKPNVVFDSSGSNARWLSQHIRAARDAGYATELLWVDVPVEIALLRNRERAAASRRGQWVPEKVIMDKAKVMSSSFEKLCKEVDSSARVTNWSKHDGELKLAQEDLYWYPGPRERPLFVRPGDRDYARAPDGARSPSRSRHSIRKIAIGPWKRDDKVMAEKNKRLKWMDRKYPNRHEYILKYVMRGRKVYLEHNRYPYRLPPGMQHWTIWALKDMHHEELCEYIEGWLRARAPHNVVSWNYDDNRGRRTIDLWHLHVYFQGADGQAPVFGGKGNKERAGSTERASASRSRSPCSV